MHTDLSPEELTAFEALRSALQAGPGTDALPARDGEIFWLRLERYFSDFYQPLSSLYGSRPDFQQWMVAIGLRVLSAYSERPDPLKLLDLERELRPDWFQRHSMVGGIYYVDRFAGTLAGVREHLDYFRDLGLTYIHLMPLLKPRPGENDGGYAVEDYRAVNPELGSIEDLTALASDLHQNGMSLCIDIVLNHTAKEHEWARQAQAGNPLYLDFYYMFPDRTEPDRYEETLPEVFPTFAPGNFTWYPNIPGSGRWVWTTFNEYQWDLNYTNPAVFTEMLANLMFLANLGVDVLRLDAVPFMWKRMGTNCQNQPEVLDILQAMRGLMRVACPGTVFKAEAIVAPDDLVQYLGLGQRVGNVCEIAYHNSLMVLLWSSLASRKVTLMTHSLLQMPPTPPRSAWVTYVRCHDDIGWAITDENAEHVGENGRAHRQFLNDFYSGVFPGSFARGELFQYNPITKDARMSGMTASLAGLETALERNDSFEIDGALGRIELLYSMALAYGGIPLIYMGDELGLLNDPVYLQDETRASDNRWLHRPAMDWELAAQRHDPRTVPGRIFKAIRHLIAVRKQTPVFHSEGSAVPIWTGNQHVLGFVRKHARGRVLVLGNFQDSMQHIQADVLWQAELRGEICNLLDGGNPIQLRNDRVTLQPYGSLWLTGSQ